MNFQKGSLNTTFSCWILLFGIVTIMEYYNNVSHHRQSTWRMSLITVWNSSSLFSFETGERKLALVQDSVTYRWGLVSALWSCRVCQQLQGSKASYSCSKNKMGGGRGREKHCLAMEELLEKKFHLHLCPWGFFCRPPVGSLRTNPSVICVTCVTLNQQSGSHHDFL